MRRSILSVLVVFALATPLRAADVLYVKAGRLVLDVTKPPVVPGAVVITDGVVTAAGANVAAPAGARQLDLGAFTVMPALLDAHTHLGGGPGQRQDGEPQPVPSGAASALRAQKNIESALKLGVAAIRVLGTGDFVDVALRNAVDDGTIVGPHILPAGYALGPIGGHGDRFVNPATMPMLDVYSPLYGFVTSPADAEKAVQWDMKNGARVIKLMASGGVGSPLDSPLDRNLTVDEMRAAVEQAHMHRLKVAAHAENAGSIMDAMKAGVDSIEHGSEMTQDTIDYMKAHNVIYVPTVRVGMIAAGVVPGRTMTGYSLDKAKLLLKSHVESFELALKNGVTMAAGSDDGYGPGSTGLIAELVTDVEHGMTAKAALQAATLQNASLMGYPKLGAIAPGMEGSIIAVDGDPLTDIKAIERMRAVVFKGKVIVKPGA